jgi:Ca-activated chloride channel homolog
MNKKLVPLVLIVLSCAMVLSAAPQQAPSQAPTQGNAQAPDPNFELPGRPPAGAQGPGLPTGPTLNPDTNNPQPAANATNQPAAPAANAPAGNANAGTATANNAPATAPTANQPGNTVTVPQGNVVTKRNGEFSITKNVEEVRLYATVVNERQQLVTNLQKNDFQIWENGQLQSIKSFRSEDVPVALGIVIDNSGSMRDKRPAVNQAALNLVRSSNKEDKVFVVNFNSEPYLDQDFTANIAELKDALDHIDSRGGTALYDSVAAASDHLMKMRDPNEKKVILIVTDGEDNASTLTLERAVQDVAVDGGPTIYTIGILGGEKEKRARRALRILAEETGGVAFFPKDISEVDSISKQIAHDIRNQYILQYQPTTAKAQGGYRMVKVTANAPGYKRLQVRTRSGYYAGQKTQTSAANSTSNSASK